MSSGDIAVRVVLIGGMLVGISLVLAVIIWYVMDGHYLDKDRLREEREEGDSDD